MKAFDLVSWDGLFNILLMIGYPLKLQSMIISFHDSMRATIQYKAIIMSKPFDIKSGVKQGSHPCSNPLWHPPLPSSQACFWEFHRRGVHANKIERETRQHCKTQSKS